MSQSNQLPIWLRQMNGWEDAPPWLLELIVRFEQGPGFEGLEDLPSDLGFETGRSAAAAPGEEDDWLSRLEAEVPVEETPVEPGPVPDWLAGLETETPAAEPPVAPEAEVPDWLSGIETEVPAPEAESGEQEQVPEWLAGFESRLAAEQEREAEEEEAPDWLGGIEPEIPEPEAGPSGATWLPESEPGAAAAEKEAPEPEAQVPDWLAGLETGAPDWLSQAQAGDSPVDTAPDWLAEFEQEPEAPAEGEEPQVEAGAPDWLSREQTEMPEVEPEVPDWLAAVRAETEAPAEEKAPDPLSRLEPEAPELEPEVPDWLAAPSAEVEEPPAKEGAPDWLSRLESEAPAVEPGTQPTPDQEASVPEWLARMTTKAPGEQDEPDTEPDVPAWLAGLEPVEEPEPSDQDQGVPEWLAQMTEGLPGQEVFSEQAEETEPEPEEGIPSWLAGMGTGRLAGEEASLAWLDEQMETAPAEPAAEPPAPPEEEEGVPGWLQDMGEVSAAAESPPARGVTDWLHGIQDMPVPSQQVSEEPEGEPTVPEWLQELETAVPAQGVEEASAPEEPVEIPDWLREVPDEEAQEPEMISPSRDEEQEPQIELPVTPSWMQDVYTASEEPASLDDMLALPDREIAEAPEWLKELRSEQEEPPVPVAEGPEETSGPLAGLRGVLDPEPLLAIFPKSAYRPVPRVPEEQLQQVAVVERVLAEPTTQAVPAGPATGRLVLSSLGRWVMYLIVLATLLVAPLRTWIRPPDTLETQSFVNAVGGLAPGSEVLLVVDYDPALDGEMTPLARAVIWHLLQQEVGIVTVSLTPQGPAMVQDLFDEYPPLLSGVYYLNLGYLPAHPASLQAFALDPLGGATFLAPELNVGQVPLGQRINGLSDMDLVVLLTGDPSHVRWWIEQMSMLGPMDVVAAVSAAALPYVLPYYSENGEGQLKGLLAGLPAAARYENLVGAGFAPSSRENFVVTANLQLLLAAVLVLGAVLSAIRGRRRAS